MLLTARASVLRQASGYAYSLKALRHYQSPNLARLLSSLAVLEQKDGKLNRASLSAITAAQKLGGSVSAIVAGSNIQSVAKEAAQVEGLGKVIWVENGAYDKVRVARAVE